MVIFSWKKELETGIASIDRQHMQILISTNKLLLCREQEDATKELREVLAFLSHYILEHFRAEEAFQQECQYPDYLLHQAEHNYLSTQLRVLMAELEASHYESTAVDAFYEFLMGWVGGHIMEEDLRFAKVFRDYQNSFRQRR